MHAPCTASAHDVLQGTGAHPACSAENRVPPQSLSRTAIRVSLRGTPAWACLALAAAAAYVTRLMLPLDYVFLASPRGLPWGALTLATLVFCNAASVGQAVVRGVVCRPGDVWWQVFSQLHA